MRWLALSPVAVVLSIWALLALTGCDRIAEPHKHGALVVAVREAPSLFQHEGTEGSEITGFNYDTAFYFATALGLKVQFIVAADLDEMLQLVRDGKVHFAAALAVAATDAKVDGLRLSSELRQAQPVLVHLADTPAPDSLDKLSGHAVEAMAGTPQATTLAGLPDSQRPTLIERRDPGDAALLERVANRTSALTASDNVSLDIATHVFPDLAVAAKLPGKLRFVWAFPKWTDQHLFDRAEGFIEHIRYDGTLARLSDRYFGHIRRVTPQGKTKFLEHRETLLPHFRRAFVAAQEVTGIDWRLLAALAYQESKWDPLATSPTGVRGMMMLTGETADSLNVTDRLDAAQSISAGARYLSGILAELPESTVEPDRTWLALAAYNVGMGHLREARKIARELKHDANSWYEMKQVLPLLARPEYYKRIKGGRGRGGEAVIMVENVRTYFDILSRLEPALKFTLTPPFKRRK